MISLKATYETRIVNKPLGSKTEATVWVVEK